MPYNSTIWSQSGSSKMQRILKNHLWVYKVPHHLRLLLPAWKSYVTWCSNIFISDSTLWYINIREGTKTLSHNLTLCRQLKLIKCCDWQLLLFCTNAVIINSVPTYCCEIVQWPDGSIMCKNCKVVLVHKIKSCRGYQTLGAGKWLVSHPDKCTAGIH